MLSKNFAKAWLYLGLFTLAPSLYTQAQTLPLKPVAQGFSGLREATTETTLQLPLQSKTVPGRVQYKLIDLGACDLAFKRLSKNAKGPSFAPAINDLGQIIFNTSQGGILKDPLYGHWMPYIHDVKIHFRSLTNKGDILASLHRKSQDTEWVIWPTQRVKEHSQKESIMSPGYSKAHFNALSDLKIAIGCAKIEGEDAPLVKRPNQPAQMLLSAQDKSIKGEFKAINQNFQIAGYLKNGQEKTPAVWSEALGLKFLKHFRSKVLPDGHVELADLLIAADGTVYGTYSIRFASDGKQSNYYAYAWLPFEGDEFKMLDLDGMRLSCINEKHTLVGSLAGQAAICEAGSTPIALQSIIREEELEGWDLLEATAINTFGDIVGYGKFNGQNHLFLAQRENSQTPYNLKHVHAK